MGKVRSFFRRNQDGTRSLVREHERRTPASAGEEHLPTKSVNAADLYGADNSFDQERFDETIEGLNNWKTHTAADKVAEKISEATETVTNTFMADTQAMGALSDTEGLSMYETLEIEAPILQRVREQARECIVADLVGRERKDTGQLRKYDLELLDSYAAGEADWDSDSEVKWHYEKLQEHCHNNAHEVAQIYLYEKALETDNPLPEIEISDNDPEWQAIVKTSDYEDLVIKADKQIRRDLDIENREPND